MQIESRDQIDLKYRWDLEAIFPTDEDFLSALKSASAYPDELEAFKGKISKSPQDLLGYLRVSENAGIELGKLANYAMRKSDEDTRESKYQDYSSRVMLLITQISRATSWSNSELLTLTEEEVEQMYEKCPELEHYRVLLNRIFRMRKHVLSPAEEALLASAQEMASQPENIFSLLNDADLKFDDAIDSNGESHPVTHGSYIPLMTSPDRVLRKSAYDSLYKTYGQFKNTCAATLNAQVKQLKFYSDARKYNSSLEYALDGNEIPPSVYTNLIDAVHDNLPAMHKYISLRKKTLGLDDLRYYDLYVPIVENVEMKFTYEQACDIILKALEPMGEDYLSMVREGLENRWIDVYENPGKRSGAYSAGGYGMHPYILMNFQGELDDVFTLVHEMGHSIHTYLSCQNQPPCYADYVIFVAEVASTCNESLLMNYLLDKATDPKEHAFLVNHFLEEFRGTVYRQTMFAEFELAVNEMAARGEGITADALCEKYAELNREYYGDEIEVDDSIALEWARIPHFYYEYYVYQYATGFSAAIALSRQILEEGEPAVRRYLDFLKGGSSKTPIELLKGAGVDMSTPEPVNEALKFFDSLVDELAKALEK
ncbi:MAG: oligoendopeptidase F [Coriobacteriales bacterium]|jgi:oligoendopeptidase F